MKKLTIITINFNHKEGLKRTIDSIVNQTFTDYEWIVVDGGSTDGSRELIEQYQDHFDWWCSEPDKGVYNAMNKGVAHATGEYVNFMNSGDIFAGPTVLEDVFGKPRTADILFGLMMRQNDDGSFTRWGFGLQELHWFDFYHENIGHQAEFSKRTLYAHKHFDESFKIIADWDWNAYMIAVQRKSSQCLSNIICIYEGNGLTEKQKEVAEMELEIVRNRYYYSLKTEDIREYENLIKIKRFSITRAMYTLILRACTKCIKMKRFMK